MAEFDAKFKEMQKYLPFLKNVIDKLRSSSDQSDDNPRRAQLKKMEVLHDLLKSNGKKLKMETLLKCEGLLIKLHSKMVRIPLLQNESDTSKTTTTTPTQTSNTNHSTIATTTTTMSNNEVPRNSIMNNSKVSSVEVVDITGPESPPPQYPMEEEPPVEIPTERRTSPTREEKTARSEHHRDRHSKHSSRHKHDHHKHSSHYHHHSGSTVHYSGHSQNNQQLPTREYHEHDRYSNDKTNIFNRRSGGLSERSCDSSSRSSSHHDKYRAESHINRDPRASTALPHDIYSPGEGWGEVVVRDGERTVNFNKAHFPSNPSEMFSRVRNPERSGSVAASSRPTTPIAIALNVPTMPDVLKSPPLSASDISDLLNESDDKITSDNKSGSDNKCVSSSIPSISEIGTRRPAKPSTNSTTTTLPPKTTDSNTTGIIDITTDAASTLDKVRKKFAIVTQNSPQLRSSPDIVKSPVTSTVQVPRPIQSSVTTQPKTNVNPPLPVERVALRYNPHPRSEAHSASQANADPRLNPNRSSSTYNSAAPHDPRLRKAAEASAPSSLYQQVQQAAAKPPPPPPPVSPASNSIGIHTTHRMGGPVATTIANAANQAAHVSHIPSIVDGEVVPPRIPIISTGFPNAAMDPRQQSQGGIFSRREQDYATNDSPAMKFAKKIVQRRKSGCYDSEENWDSDENASNVTDEGVGRGRGGAALHIPRGEPLMGPRITKILPYVDARVKSQVGSQAESQITEQQARPQVRPQVGPQARLQVGPQARSQVGPQARTQAGPHARPQVGAIPQIHSQHRTYVRPHDEHTGESGGYRPVKAPLLPTPAYGPPNAANSMPTHMHQHSTAMPLPNTHKFSPLLNDKVERSKYFESKKHKQSEPRTYFEYKQAKARAAAEEAARKAAAEAAEIAAEVQKDVGEVSEVDKDVLAKLGDHPATPSTLDKMYRSTNFSKCDFPKPNTASFKIPKKIVEKPVSEKDGAEMKGDTKKEKEDVKENKEAVAKDAMEKEAVPKEAVAKKTVAKEAAGNEAAQSKKEEKEKEKAATIAEPTAVISAAAENKKTEVKDKVPAKKDKDKGRDRGESSDKKDKKRRLSKENVKKDDFEVSKNKTNQVKRKSLSKTLDNTPTANKTPTTDKTPTADKTPMDVKENEANIETTNVIETTPTIKDIICESVETTKDAVPVVEAISTDETKEKTEDVVQSEQTHTQTSAENQCCTVTDTTTTEGLETKKLSDAAVATKGETSDATAIAKDETSDDALLKKLESPQKPARILRRRNTMIVRGSLPEVDKEKIFTCKSLVYEDIQGANEEERRQKLDAKLPKKNKCLAEIFQKTDDNCTVSTQNIISGKRRTRATINFNEVKRTQEIFRCKRRSEPAKTAPTEETSPAAEVMAQENTPKAVKKGAKGKGKNADSGELSAAESVEKLAEKEIEANAKQEGSELESRQCSEHQTEQGSENKVEHAENAAAEKTTKPASKIDALIDEDAQKRHLLESFVQDILNPKKDKVQIFSLLSQILSEENLKFVKEIVESTAEKNAAAQNEEANDEAADECESVATVSDELNKPNEDETKNTSSSSGSKAVKSAKVRKNSAKAKGKGFRKKSELDRLNEDIRTMFISSGVLTATGRRMCTLVAAAEEATTATSTDDAKAATAEQTAAAAHATAAVQLRTRAAKAAPKGPLPRLRKAKVVLEQINMKAIQKRAARMKRVQAKKNAKAGKTKGKKRKSGENKAATEDGDGESELVGTPPRKMPILKANTPIKQSEVDDDEAEELDGRPAAKKMKLDVKAASGKRKVRPGPKSKKPKCALPSDHDEDEDEGEGIGISAVTAKAAKANTATEKKPKANKKSLIPKNTNMEWHSQSKWNKWCMICDKKVTYATTHYKQEHDENYISRLPPDTLAQLRTGTSTRLSKPFFGVHHKKLMNWSYRCLFCQQHNRTIMCSWVDHFITHTGEYAFHCSKCKRPSNKSIQIDKHIKRQCQGGTVIRNPTIPAGSLVRAHVCHLCNYTQLLRQNLDSHLVQQHGIAKTKIDKNVYVIDLLDTREVKIVNALKAVELEEKILNAGLHGDIKLDDIEEDAAADSDAEADSDDDNDEDGHQDDANADVKDEAENVKREEVKCPLPKLEISKVKVNNENDVDSDGDDDDADSQDSDDMPIVKVCRKDAKKAAKKAAEKAATATDAASAKAAAAADAAAKAANSNVFVPTRETNDSPTMNQLAQTLFPSNNDQMQVDIGAAVGGVTKETRSGAVNAATRSGISMAERLSQKFKSIQSGKAKANTNAENASGVVANAVQTTCAENTATASTATAVTHSNSTQKGGYQQGVAAANEAKNTPRATNSAAVRSELNDAKKSVANETNPTRNNVQSVVTATEKAHTSPTEDDDENWEDIEIVEHAPSKKSPGKMRNKNVLHKLNRLYATNNKLKKSLSITIGNRKKTITTTAKTTTATGADEEQHKVAEATRPAISIERESVSAAPTTMAAITGELPKEAETLRLSTEQRLESEPQPADATSPSTHIEPHLGFRPLITNLADLLPDSPCNDPIELVPELTPIESLHDLCDVSSILNADYISTDYQPTLNEMHSDNSHHVSMQEALDFVHEQQQCDQSGDDNATDTAAASAVTTTTTVANAHSIATPLMAGSIHRIQNIGYSKSGDDGKTFKFYCLSENCTFLYSNEAIGLESHFRCEHAQCTWNGYCQSCKRQVEDGNTVGHRVDVKLPLSAELNHMRTKHLMSSMTPASITAAPVCVSITTASAAASLAAPKTTSSTTIVPATVEELQQPSASNSPAPDEDRPRIKIRRLTGDCLSTTTPPATTVTPSTATEASNTKSITAFDENAQLIDLTNSGAEPTPVRTTITTSFLNKLSAPAGAEKPNTSDNRPFQNIGTASGATILTPKPRVLPNIIRITPEEARAQLRKTCQLQIASVVSLKENSVAAAAKTVTPPPIVTSTTSVPPAKASAPATAAPQLQLPVISNVCSLNVRAVSSPAHNNSGALWAKHIAEERVELERAAAESREVTRILAKHNSQLNAKEREKTPPPPHNTRNLSESPEPQVVSETLPLAQSTSGSYVITQTVSAQYEEGRVGFNISIAANPAASAPRLSRSDSASSASNLSSATAAAASAPASAAIATTAQTTVPKFKCMANGCRYQTRLPLAMGDHLLFHDRQNFSAQREYLRCSQCSHLADDVDGFLHHTEEKHGMMMRSGSGGGNSETETIRDILRNTDSNSSSQQSVIGGNNANTTSTSNASKKTTASTNGKNNEMAPTFTQETWESALKDIIAASGVADSKLFRCTIDDCRTKLTESNYYSHVVYHLSTLGQFNISTHTYKCPHCKCAFNKPQKIRTHIKTHGVHKYFCYLCTATAVNIEKMHKHFEQQHWRTKKLHSTPLPYKAKEQQTSLYVLYTSSLSPYDIQQFREKLISEWQRKKSSARTHFKPSEIGLLPLTPIFGKDLNCAICPYKTKVRTNLMRHLQMHPDDNNGGTQLMANVVDPINPVPCLNSNEKHFDKMTNLASSSLVVGSAGSGSGGAASGNAMTTSGGVGGGGDNSTATAASGAVGNKVIYEYIPDTKRYTCGVSNCQYLTISDDIFRSHLSALHSDITQYNCPHCKEELCKRNLSLERILSHLRFHGPKLYQCEFCGYLHYMRNVVDRHTRQHDVHPPAFVKVIVYDRTKDNAKGAKKADKSQTPESTNANTNSSQAANKSEITLKSKQNSSSGKHKWVCNLCGHKTNTQQKIIAHAQAQHSCKHQYQCVHCQFTAAQLVNVLLHIDDRHGVGKKREVRRVYEQKIDDENGNGNGDESSNSSSGANAIDTRPLWQRDDPTRVRHIRGILMEDEEESERYRKRLCLNDNYDDDDDDDEGAENAEVSVENVNINQFGYLCYYCNLEFQSPQDLCDKHWQASNCKKFNAEKPFRYRICTQLKCPHCLAFEGNSFKLLEHMTDIHMITKYMAVDPQATAAGMTCGHCEYRGQTLAQLAQHNTRMRHKPLDLKAMSPAQLLQLRAMGKPLTYVQCLNCMELLADQPAFAAHTKLVHSATQNACSEVKSQKLKNTLIYACPVCQYASQQEMIVLRHMIDHYGGFKRCYYCSQPQTTFNGYMQHCYSDHREEIKKFGDIYTFADISKYLQQLQLIFPNGLTVDLYNIRLTQCFSVYSNNNVKLLYDEIKKTSQQPPIPRLSLGRLVARKSIEAKLAENGGATSPASAETASASTAAALQLAGNYAKPLRGGGGVGAATGMPQKIMKRRSTVALGRRDDSAANLSPFAIPSPTSDMSLLLPSGKKRKIQKTVINLPAPSSSMKPYDHDDPFNFGSVSDNESVVELDVERVETSESELLLQPYSFYGKKAAPMDLSKIFIKIAAGDAMETRVNISKFKLLYNISPRVVVAPTDMTKYRKAAAPMERKVIKPCPASHKIRYM